MGDEGSKSAEGVLKQHEDEAKQSTHRSECETLSSVQR